MVRKLNRSAAEAYSENFSSKVLDDFFSTRMAASGQDILELTPVQQVNLLMIQKLYQQWQDEALRLRSPYFNYEHPQVQESLQAFMNTLSRHILVEREALEPLLRTAVLDSLRLLLNPLGFFDEFLRKNPSLDSLQGSLRYLRWQQSLTDVLHEQIEKREMGEPEYLLAMLEAGVRSGNLELDTIDEPVQTFEQVLPMPQGLIEEPATPKPAPPKIEEEHAGDFFSSISRLAPRTPKSAPPAAETASQASSVSRPAPPADRQQDNPAPRPQPQMRPTTPVEQEPPSRPQPTREAAPAPVISEAEAPQFKPVAPEPKPAAAPAPPAAERTPAPKKQEDDSRSLNNRFERSEKKPLYEQFEPKESRSSSISQKQRSNANASIRHYITLNQRFMFVKELFGGNANAFNAALDTLDACQNLREAHQWVEDHLAHKPQWEEESEVAQEFHRVLEHRFGS